MNILLVTPVFLGRDIKGSGMPMAIYRIAEGLKKMGENPLIVTGGNEEKYEIFHGIPLWRVKTERMNIFFSEKKANIVEKCVLENFILQRKVNELCKQIKIDIIQYAGNNGTGMFHSRIAIKVPAVMRVSSYYKLSYAGSETYSKREILLHSFFERLAMKRMDGIYCPSSVMADYLTNEIKRKVSVIETPFYIEEGSEDASYVRSKMKNKKYMLYFGSVNPQKGVLVLAKAANKILERYRNYYIVIIGNDFIVNEKSVKDIMKKQIHEDFLDRFLLFPAMEHRRLYPFIKSAEVILQPSYMENLSNACMEAMAFGKIVIGTIGASYEQLITDGVNGFLIKRGSAADLYRSVCRAMDLTEAEKKRMGILAQKRIEKMKPEISIKKLLQYYNSIFREIR